MKYGRGGLINLNIRFIYINKLLLIKQLIKIHKNLIYLLLYLYFLSIIFIFINYNINYILTFLLIPDSTLLYQNILDSQMFYNKLNRNVLV